jgi:hypothetical protein
MSRRRRNAKRGFVFPSFTSSYLEETLADDRDGGRGGGRGGIYLNSRCAGGVRWEMEKSDHMARRVGACCVIAETTKTEEKGHCSMRMQ